MGTTNVKILFRIHRALLLPFAFFAATASANFHPNIIRGGQGLIFGDSSSLLNPGENSLNHGLALETLGEYRKTSSGSQYLIGPSANLATWGYNLGGFYQRSGASPGDSDTETFGGTFGTHFLFRRLTAGVAYAQTINHTANSSSGKILGTLTRHFGKIHPYEGWLVSGSISHQFGTTTFPITGYTVAVGYGLNRFSGYELNLSLNDIYDTSDWSVAAYTTQKFRRYYLGTGFSFNNIRSLKLQARVGYLYEHFDASLYSDLPFSASQPLILGISIRQVF